MTKEAASELRTPVRKLVFTVLLRRTRDAKREKCLAIGNDIGDVDVFIDCHGKVIKDTPWDWEGLTCPIIPVDY